MDTLKKLRKAILSEVEPFCIQDLYSRMKRKGFTDKGLILQVLDELSDEGFVKYIPINDKDIQYAFIIQL